jgi:hypothetical protein
MDPDAENVPVPDFVSPRRSVFVSLADSVVSKQVPCRAKISFCVAQLQICQRTTNAVIAAAAPSGPITR